MKLRKAHRFRMEPTKDQEQFLLMVAGARRFIWNWALGRRKAFYAETGKSLSPSALCKELTELKKQPETSWLNKCSSQALQQPIDDLTVAYTRFFKRASKFPKFKSRKTDQLRFRCPQSVKIVSGMVFVPKLGWVKIRQSEDVGPVTKSATFKRDASGHWFVTIVAEFDMPDSPLVPADPANVVGVDLGLKEFAVLSNGVRFESNRFYRKASRKLKKAQRELSRRKRGSARCQKSKIKIAKIHQKIKNQRVDSIHKITTGLVEKYDGVCIENLNTKGLARTKLAKSILDASFGEFRRQLEYKSVWHRRHLVAVNTFYPSSKTCSCCGAIYQHLKLADRTWTCPACLVVHDRDLNAAINIRAEGLKKINCKVAVGHTETINACGGTIRPEVIWAGLVEARTLPEAGIPAPWGGEDVNGGEPRIGIQASSSQHSR